MHSKVNGEESSWQAEEPQVQVNGWQQKDKLDVTASGRRNCIVQKDNPPSRR